MPSTAPPKVIISATSADLGSQRQLVREALFAIGCYPVVQQDFDPDWRTVDRMLHAKIDDCVALVHIVGLRYGGESDPDTHPTGTPRRSFTQREYDIGCQLQQERGDDHFRVYVFVLPEDFAYDAGAEPESEQQQAAQSAHRTALLTGLRRYETPATPELLDKRIRLLKEPVLALRREQVAVQREVRRSHKNLRRALTHIASGITEIRQSLVLDAPRIKAHLHEASERRLAVDIAAADGEATFDARERQRETAQAAHAARLLRIDDVVASFAALVGQAEADPILREMSRILQDEGVDQALAYAECKRPEILKAVDNAMTACQEKVRTQLQPLLKAAQLHATRGSDDAARKGYTELLALQPNWPALLETFAWYLRDQSNRALQHGSLRAAQAGAVLCLELAQRWHDAAPSNLLSARLLAAANLIVGDVLVQIGEHGAVERALKHYQAGLNHAETRYTADPNGADAARDVPISLNTLGGRLAARGQPDDAPVALAHYQRSLDILERLLAANPDSAQAARDLSISLETLGNLLVARGQPGDAALALAHYQRGLDISERLFAASPESTQVARDVSVSLNQLGKLLAVRGQPGDASLALTYCQRDLEISERLLAANPNSAQAMRDVSVSSEKLGDLLTARGQPGDSSLALALYQRSLEIGERLLAANPDSALAARDVAHSLDKLADLLVAPGQRGGGPLALSHYQRSLEIRERLLAANPDNGQAARDVAVSLNQLGNLLVARSQPGDAPLALAHCQRGLDILERLLAANPDSAQAARDVLVSLERLAK